MTDNPNFEYEKQCMSCNLADEAVNQIHSLYNAGWKFTEISAYLVENFDITISPDALSNHIRKHSKAQPVVGVVQPPKGWEPGFTMEGDTAEVTTPPQENGSITDFSDILAQFDIDPKEFEIEGNVTVKKWQLPIGEWRTSYRFSIRRKRSASSDEPIDLPTLINEVQTKRASVAVKVPASIDEFAEKRPDRTLVLPFADLQVGKSGSRGGISELTDRLEEKKEKLVKYALEQNCASAVFADMGDIIEGFENVEQQRFTNQLSLTDQVDYAITYEEAFLSILLETHDNVKAVAVPSNHAGWRKGKDYLGTPADDWGLFALKQIEKTYKKYVLDYNSRVEFIYPETWRKSVTVNASGVNIGVAHGDDVTNIDSTTKWWAQQVHGGGPLATADVLLTGHFHTFRMMPSGRNLRGQQKWWIACPTLDNGSDWYANGMGGGDSDPGLLAFVVDADKGLDFQSFTIL